MKYTGLHIVCVPFWHVPFMMQSRTMAILKLRTWRTEVDTRTSPEIWKTVKINRRMKDKIMTTGDDLHVSIQAIYFTH